MADFKSAIRPIVTLAFVTGFIAACFLSPDAVEHLETLTAAVVAFWFGGRLKAGATVAVLMLTVVSGSVSAQVVRIAGQATVCENGACRLTPVYGAGVIAHADESHQWILTADHLIDEFPKLAWAGVAEGRMVPVEVVARNPDCDVALLKSTRRFKGRPLTFRSRIVRQGEQAIISGYGGESRFHLRGVPGATLDAERIGCDVAPGDSGGPVMIGESCVGLCITRHHQGQYSRMTPFACWAPWCRRYIPLRVDAPPKPQPVPGPPVDEVQKLRDEIAQLRQELEKASRPKPFTLQLFSRSKREPGKMFDFGKVTVNGEGTYRLELPDTSVWWVDGGKQVASEAFPAGTPVMLDIKRVQPATKADPTGSD